MKLIKQLTLSLLIIGHSGTTFAAEQTVTLEVDDMTCQSCPYQVRKSLEGVEGVISAQASLETGQATVIFDDSLTNIVALTTATNNAGYPSRIAKSEIATAQ